MQAETHRDITLRLLGVVCDREKRQRVIETLENQKSFFNLALLGRGTANSRILGYLGLGETEKAVFLCVMPLHVAQETMTKLDAALHFDVPGNGITFITPVHEGCYHKPVTFAGKADGGEKVEQQTEHDMIMAVVNRGYTEDVMDAARKAGATGGTVLHARGCGLSGAERFFGVTIQPEKEVIMILAKSDTSCAIMAGIAEAHGPGTDANAISFSMPVSQVCGLGGAVPQAAQ